MISVSSRLREHAQNIAGEARVADVRIGLGYTAARLEDGRTGTAYTFLDRAKGGCTVFKGMRPLQDRPAEELLPMLDSGDPIEKAVALATANALFNTDTLDSITGDILDHLNLDGTETVGMVGYFAPVLPALRERAARVHIFEKQRIGSDIHPAEQAASLLPECEVALLTSTSILNNTLDDLLKACTSCREVVLLGASTPLNPASFAGTPVTMLSGVVVTRPDGLLRTVSEGGGMQLFKKDVRKVSIRLNAVPQTTGTPSTC